MHGLRITGGNIKHPHRPFKATLHSSMATSCKVGVHSKRDGCEKFETSVDSKEGKEKKMRRGM